MRTHSAWIGLVILELGLAVTLASGFCERNLSIPGRFAVGYGWPVVWHGRAWMVYSIEPTVSWISLDALLLDTAFWILTFAIGVLVCAKLAKRARPGAFSNTRRNLT